MGIDKLVASALLLRLDGGWVVECESATVWEGQKVCRELRRAGYRSCFLGVTLEVGMLSARRRSRKQPEKIGFFLEAA